MARSYNSNLPRAISIADYILEGDGHSTKDAAKEFGYNKTTIQRDINFLGVIAFYGDEPNSKELQEKYLNVKSTLNKIAKQNYSTAIAERNAQKKATSN